MTALKPCPFCGSPARRIANGREIYCPSCPCAMELGLTRQPMTPQELEAAWNRRAGIMTVKASGTCPVCGGCDVRVIKGESQTQVACWNPECVFSIVLEGTSIYDATKLWDRLRVVE